MSKNLTLYCTDDDKKAAAKAKRFLAFHENKSLSQFFMEKVMEVNKKYEGKK